MLPRPGISIENITAKLGYLTRTVYDATEPIDYALWIAGAESTLRECFVDVPLERLFTERYWHLTTGPVLRHYDMLRGEQRGLLDWLERVSESTSAMIRRFAEPVAPIAVLDTNVLMHGKPLEEIDWCAKSGGNTVRLVIPLRVVDELDEKKYARRKEMQNRARNRLRLLGRYVEPGVSVRAGVRAEIVGWRDLDLGGVPRPPISADVDILDSCEAVGVYAAANAVSMVTADVGMTLRARERGLSVSVLDDDDMQPIPQDGTGPRLGVTSSSPATLGEGG
jgi:hypothetical protein